MRKAIIFLLLSLPWFGQAAEDALWRDVAVTSQKGASSQAWVQPEVFRAVSLDYSALKPLLASAPLEALQSVGKSKAAITLPLPDGTLAEFRFVEAPVMMPELAAQFPEIKTYVGQGIDDTAASLRFDVTASGFHAQILSPNGAVYVDPYFQGDTNLYAVYYKRDYRKPAEEFQCLTSGGAPMAQPAAVAALGASAGNLRTYRLACAATGEYTQFQGGTVSAGMSAIVTAINRVTGIYETEVSIRLVLVASNNLIVYTNGAADPYDNANASALLSQNQSNLDAVIGSANYDVGHVFSTAGGGLAGVGVACQPGLKAFGETGTANPVGDAFYVDYVAHEMGHQFGANHPFNGTAGYCSGNRFGPSAFEPGSGSTIMAYAGICGTDDLQAHSDPYFHSISLEEILSYTAGGPSNGCAVLTVTSNTAPVVNAGPGFTIPYGTPFTLTASGSDADGDALTYCWEERDLGPAAALDSPDNGGSPLLRSFNPSASPSRTFPRLADVLNNTRTPGEMLPASNRALHFRVTARDSRSGGGCVAGSDTVLRVASNAGPFVITSPNSAGIRYGAQVVTWNVAGTASSPVNTTNVNIWLSTNGGLAFTIPLATNVPNTGTQSVVLPNLVSSSARIKVEAVGNIFFDVSDTNFSIVPAVPQVQLASATLLAESCPPGNSLIDPGETVTLNFALTNAGNANTTNLMVTLLAANGISAPSAPQSYGVLVAGGPELPRQFAFTANAVCGGTITAVLQLQDGASNLGTLTRTFSLGTGVVTTQAVTNPAFITINDVSAATPYPSTNLISGATGVVTKVTVTLYGLAHTYPDDIDVLLVGPGGQNVLIMSDTGGGNSVTNLTLTFDDSAAASLPDSARIFSGAYKPTNFDTTSDVFPAPAPLAPFGQTLSVFNGLNPNGAWSLFVRDDGAVDVGRIAQGWSLSITTSNTVCCVSPMADLAVGESVSPSVLNVGSNLVFTLSVTNLGPDTANGVLVTQALPAALSFNSATASQGACITNNGVLVCSLGSLANGASARVTVSAVAALPGALTNIAAVNSAASDPVGSNNLASATVLVNAFPTISAITNQVTDQDTPTAPIGFFIGDAETPASDLVLSAVSSDTNLVALTNIVFGGTTSNRTVTIIPCPNHYGVATITIGVSDGQAAATSAFLLTVNQVNHRPVLLANTNYFIDEDVAITLTNSATDADLPAQLLTFSLSNAPPGAVINPTNGVFTWTPTEAQGPSTNAITVMVTDNGTPPLSDAKTFTVVVNEVNVAPILAPIPDATVTLGQTLVVTNFATDADIPTNTLTFSLGTNAPTGAEINPTNGLITWTPTAAQAPSTNLIVVLVADDGLPSLSATQSFMVFVVRTNSSRPLPPVPDQTVIEGLTLVVTNLMIDPASQSNTVTFSLGTNAPLGAVINPTNGLFSWAPTEAQGPSTNLITVCATNSGAPGSTATQSFKVFVLESNCPPVLTPIPDHIIHAGCSLTVSNFASDPDIPANTLAFSLGTNAPAGAAINPTNGSLTLPTSDADANTTNIITVRVTDDGSPPLSDTKSFMITILPRPLLTSLGVSNGVTTVTWRAIQGQVYRVQYVQDLGDTNWVALIPDVTATGPLATQTDAVASAPRRFYRVRLVP